MLTNKVVFGNDIHIPTVYSGACAMGGDVNDRWKCSQHSQNIVTNALCVCCPRYLPVTHLEHQRRRLLCEASVGSD
jgi:hypothetical protein